MITTLLIDAQPRSLYFPLGKDEWSGSLKFILFQKTMFEPCITLSCALGVLIDIVGDENGSGSG